MMKIVVLDGGTLPVSIPKPKWCKEWVFRNHTSFQELVPVLKNADVAITNKVGLCKEVLENLPKLRHVCVAATGYDCIDIDFCSQKRITVSNVPYYSNNSVSETVIGYIFALRRCLVEYNYLAFNTWRHSPFFCLHDSQKIEDVEGATLGIIGRGSIGRSVGKKARMLGMKVIYADRKGVSNVREGYTIFEKVIAQSDILTLHCPLSIKTYKIIDKNTIKNMKSGALLINTARGGLIDESALAEALLNHSLGGAALDVLTEEPPHSPTPLLEKKIPRLILSPHIAWASRSSIRKLIAGINDNLSEWYSGNLKNRVV